MINISYPFLLISISILWVLVRGMIWLKSKHIAVKREFQLLLVYICVVVVARFTFFPFGKVNGEIQPLVFDAASAFPPRFNLVPLVHLFDYPKASEALLNLIGNTAMFIPLGIVWPSVFKTLDRHEKVIASGAGFSLLIEILQLPFFDRVSDVDDLILNSLGFFMGYGLYLIVKRIKQRRNDMA